MSRIKPFWRIVLGFLLLCFCVYNTNMLAFGGNAFAFAFWWAALAAYIFCAIKIKYDDPLRSMRDLMAKQTEEKKAEGKDSSADRIAALEKELAELREQLKDKSE